MNLHTKLFIIAAAVALFSIWNCRCFSSRTKDGAKAFWIIAALVGTLATFIELVLTLASL